MMRKPIGRELLWVVPFLCIALIAAGLLRHEPRFPAPEHFRTVVDGGGNVIKIALPFRGIALATNSFPSGYLESTRSPQLLVFAGKPSDRDMLAQNAMSWIYPEVLNNNKLWNTRLFRENTSPFTEVETLLAYDPSVWIGCGGSPDLVRRVGLPAFGCGGSPAQRERMGLPSLRSKEDCGTPPDPMRSRYPKGYVNSGWYYPENYLFPGIRSSAELIGHPEFAEPRIDSYCAAIAGLRQQLQPASLAFRPRVQMEGESRGNAPRAGVIDAEVERRIPGDDAERLLVMDPDMIFMVTGTPQQFARDLRWQGLKAVQNHRVYRRPGQLEFWATGLTIQPVIVRWMAEVAHPERLQPAVRQLLRDRVMSEFGYRLSEEQIDLILHVKENAGSVGAERFTRGYQATSEQGSSK
ncbi:MAG: hypothetical protein P4M01_06240 [Acidobacteriota bacterium]|nr:hypothetical protein [Acidobacteriota bacterium]